MVSSEPDNLNTLLNNAQQSHFHLRCQASPHGRIKFTKHPDLFNKVKKDIARIKTLLKEMHVYTQKK